MKKQYKIPYIKYVDLKLNDVLCESPTPPPCEEGHTCKDANYFLGQDYLLN